MADKPTLYIDYRTGKIRGPSEAIGHLFANPKLKSWYGPPESMMVISDPQRFRQTVERLRQLGYPLLEDPPRQHQAADNVPEDGPA
jgi:hypothetical protein